MTRRLSLSLLALMILALCAVTLADQQHGKIIVRSLTDNHHLYSPDTHHGSNKTRFVTHKN